MITTGVWPRFRMSVLIAAVAAVALAGCSADTAPTAGAADADAGLARDAAPMRLSFADLTAPAPAGKTTGKGRHRDAADRDDGEVTAVGAAGARVVSAAIGPAGGELIVDDTGGRPHDDLRVTFTVPPGALDETRTITMTVDNDLLSEIVVGFDPTGVRFELWATLDLYLGSERVDVDPALLTAVHILDDGTEEPVGSAVHHRGNSKTYEVWVEVPGFSRYGLR